MHSYCWFGAGSKICRKGRSRTARVELLATVTVKQLADWSNYICEMLEECLNNAQPIGGPGTVVRLDEAYMHGRRKNHVGRLMRGNCVAPARQNYCSRTIGSWVFGMFLLCALVCACHSRWWQRYFYQLCTWPAITGWVNVSSGTGSHR